MEIARCAGKHRCATGRATTRCTPVDPKTLEFPAFWVPTPEVLSSAPGMHRWIWDMHYAAPEGVSGGRRRRGAGAGAWAPPGNYRVRLTYAGKSYEQPLTIKPDPRIQIGQRVYDEQFAMAQRALDGCREAGSAPSPSPPSCANRSKRSASRRGICRSHCRRSMQLVGEARCGRRSGSRGLRRRTAAGDSLRSVSGELMAVFAAVESADDPPTAHRAAGPRARRAGGSRRTAELGAHRCGVRRRKRTACALPASRN